MHFKTLESTDLVVFKYFSSEGVDKCDSFINPFSKILPSDGEVVSEALKMVDLHVFQGKLNAVEYGANHFHVHRTINECIHWLDLHLPFTLRFYETKKYQHSLTFAFDRSSKVHIKHHKEKIDDSTSLPKKTENLNEIHDTLPV